MNYDLTIGPIGIRVHTSRPTTVDPLLEPFLGTLDRPDMEVTVSWDCGQAPDPGPVLQGEDQLMEFFQTRECFYTRTKGGNRGYLATCRCSLDFSKADCYINSKEFFYSISRLGDLLRILPMRAILQHYDVLFFHAARIGLGGKGILFAAPSGTGKTTQAKLWQRCRGATILCNDRTLVHRGLTYSFPLDGSEPVRSEQVLPLGALVVLSQGVRNRVRRLRSAQAVSSLMTQLVIDTWDPSAVSTASEQLLDLTAGYPVYALECVPDESAVACLEQALMEDGVI